MNLETVYLTPSAAITLTCAEVQLIRDCAALHYDAKCKRSAELGGFLYGWMNQIVWAVESDSDAPWIETTFGQCDLVLKILEVVGFGGILPEINMQTAYRLKRFFWDVCETLGSSHHTHLEENP